MEFVSLFRALISFVGVILLILLVGWLARRFGLEKRLSVTASSKGRLTVLDHLYLDPRRRLVLVQRDETCHLLLLGGEREQVVESFPAKAELAP